jgi:hypothetical protein
VYLLRFVHVQVTTVPDFAECLDTDRKFFHGREWWLGIKVQNCRGASRSVSPAGFVFLLFGLFADDAELQFFLA